MQSKEFCVQRERIVGVAEEVRSFENFRMQEERAGRGGSPEFKMKLE